MSYIVYFSRILAKFSIKSGNIWSICSRTKLRARSSNQTHYEKLTTALEEAGVDYTLIIFPNSGHGLENDSDKYEEYINSVTTYMNKCFGFRTVKSRLFSHVFERHNHVKVIKCVDIAVDQPGHLLEPCKGPFFLCKR
jgi:hypothetical protein